jgi:transcription initiation factor TFIID subunit 15
LVNVNRGLVSALSASKIIHLLISRIATKADVESHFNTHGTGEITEIKLMNGFGFIEYKDAMDARDVVPGTALSNIPSSNIIITLL